MHYFVIISKVVILINISVKYPKAERDLSLKFRNFIFRLDEIQTRYINFESYLSLMLL